MKRPIPVISIIIPVLNEERTIGKTLGHLYAHSDPRYVKEIIVVDGGSTDDTITIAKTLGAIVVPSPKGRAKQMNLGAAHAQASILYFLHVDTLPPPHFDRSIVTAVQQGNSTGCFQMRFDSNSYFLRFFAWFTWINVPLCRGGDQSLFITADYFQRSTGFNESYTVYEDNEFINRLYKKGDFKILPRYVHTSARRYEEVGEIRLQYHFGIIHLKNFLGAGPEQLLDYYQRKISRHNSWRPLPSPASGGTIAQNDPKSNPFKSDS